MSRSSASIITRSSSSTIIESSLNGRSRPKIQIELDGQTEGLVNSYITKDRIDGTATITVDKDTRFDEVQITFEGTSKTAVERVSFPGRNEAFQTFLKLRQPIYDSAYPTPRVLEKGRTYQFPFTFVVPDHLLPHACSHPKTNAHVQRSHILVPPTLGDPMLASNGKSLLDDMVPELVRISYLIRVTIKRRENDSAKTLASVGKKVRVIPVVDEEPPLNIPDNDSIYRTRKEKDVKRTLMRGKLGRLVVATSQPKPIQLTPSNDATTDSVGSVAKVHLRFDPVGDEKPPRLGSVWSRLRVSTFYSAAPWDDYPSTSSSTVWAQIGKGSCNETVPLSTLCIASAQWMKHSTSDSPVRRDSLLSTSSTETLTGTSAWFTGGIYYTACVIVPINLPTTKAFVPTFHSCLISRTYALELNISYRPQGTNLLVSTMALKVPIQLTSQPKAGVRSNSTDLDITQEEIEAEYFRPRSIAPPSIHGYGTVPAMSVSPPEYTETRNPLLSERGLLVASTTPGTNAESVRCA